MPNLRKALKHPIKALLNDKDTKNMCQNDKILR